MRVFVLLMGLSFFSVAAFASSEPIRVNFDDAKPGELPKGWKVDATHPGKRLAEWTITPDTSAPTKPNILTLTKPSNSTFNLCWTNDIRFKDGTIEAKIRVNTGEEDRGGRRIQLDDAKANVKTGGWFIMTISQKGDAITAWLNGQELLHAKDSTFSEEGGVGFWTKADAATSFDDLVISKE